MESFLVTEEGALISLLGFAHAKRRFATRMPNGSPGMNYLPARYREGYGKTFPFRGSLSYRVCEMPIQPRLIGLARNAVWQDLMQVADQLLAEMKAEAFENDDDRELIKAEGAAEFLESLRKAIESIPVP
jgi:hypothetical protein